MPRCVRQFKRFGLKDRVRLLEQQINNMKVRAEKYGEAEFARGYELGIAYAKRAAINGDQAT